MIELKPLTIEEYRTTHTCEQCGRSRLDPCEKGLCNYIRDHYMYEPFKTVDGKYVMRKGVR